jgi:hypothetical protein
MKSAQKLKDDYAHLALRKKSSSSISDVLTYMTDKKALDLELETLLLAAGSEFSQIVDSIQLLEAAWMATGATEMDFENYGEQVCTIIGCIPLTIAKALKIVREDALEALLWMEDRGVSE